MSFIRALSNFCRGQTEIVHDTSSGNRWTIRLVLPLAKVGDTYTLTYPNEPQFNKTLRVVEVKGDQPESLVFFEDGTHSKQKYLAEVPRVPARSLSLKLTEVSWI